MKLNRYEFEILSFLEQGSETEHTVREIADGCFLSGSIVTERLKELEKEGFLSENLQVTEKGMRAMEPFRVRRAIILAAGFGSRMLPATLDKPKPMVSVGKVRIIDTLLDALLCAGIRDITIVRGYKKEKTEELKEKYPFLKFRDNPLYETTNNISSVIEALDLLKGGCYLCEADLLISNPHVIPKYQFCSNILGSWSLMTDDWSFRMKDGYICDYRKGNTFCYNYYGISYWSAEDCEKLCKDYREIWEEPDGKQYFWEFIPLVLRKDRYRVEIRQCKKEDIVEIDSYEELMQLDPSYERLPEGGETDREETLF